MYILFFGGFIFFLDWINFIIDLNNKKKKEKKHKNLLLRYLHACDERNSFIMINHYLCIVGILFSVLAQLFSLFAWGVNTAFLEYIILFLVCFLFYLASFQVARALLLHYKDANNIGVKLLFFFAFLFVILAIIGIEMYILITYMFL